MRDAMSPAMNSLTVARRAPVSTHPGFTMIELLITVVILAVLAAIAVPSMREFIARQRVESIAKELATDLRFLRTEAIQRTRDVHILFLSSTSSTCYVLYSEGLTEAECICARTDGLPICGDPELPGANREFKSVTIARNRGIALSANPVRLNLGGYNGLPRNNQVFQASVAGIDMGGEIRVFTTADDLIVPKLCSVSGRHGSIAACAR